MRRPRGPFPAPGGTSDSFDRGMGLSVALAPDLPHHWRARGAPKAFRAGARLRIRGRAPPKALSEPTAQMCLPGGLGHVRKDEEGLPEATASKDKDRARCGSSPEHAAPSAGMERI